MKRTVPFASLAAVTGLLALGAAASPALGATHTLNLSGPSTVVVGEPVVFQVTGTAAPPSEFWNLSWIEVFALPPSVVSECPPDAHSGGQLAEGTGGAILTIAMNPNKDEAGNFSNQVGATPSAPGRVLLCAYTVNEEGGTLSRASLMLTIVERGDPTVPSPPAGTPAPSACQEAQAAVVRAKERVRRTNSRAAKEKLRQAKQKRKIACGALRS